MKASPAVTSTRFRQKAANPHDITPNIKSSPACIAWVPGSQRILFEAREGGGVSFGIVDAASGDLRDALEGR